ncbi:MAG TPA: hypothetical protein VKE69_09050, partial [Planctomycetota bacterium]|nr:hypothetical protein [Planctomycetota bacterium]
EDLEMLRALRDEVRGEGDGNEPSRDLMEKVVSMLTEALRSRRDGEPAATSTTSARPAIAPAARTTSDAAPSARARERVDAFLEQLDEECANASDPESLAPEMVDAIGLLPPALREAIYTGADLSVVADALSPYPSAALSRFGERLGTPKVQEWLASLVVAIRTEHAARTAPAAEPASPAVAAAAPAVSSAGEPALPRDEPPRSRVGAAPARAAAAPNGRAA